MNEAVASALSKCITNVKWVLDDYKIGCSSGIPITYLKPLLIQHKNFLWQFYHACEILSGLSAGNRSNETVLYLFYAKNFDSILKIYVVAYGAESS